MLVILLFFSKDMLCTCACIYDKGREEKKGKEKKRNSLQDALAFNDALAVLSVNLGLALLELKQRIELRRHAEDQTHGPEAIGMLRQRLGGGPLADAGRVADGQHVEGQVSRVSDLAADGGVAQEGLERLCVGGLGGGLYVLEVLANAHDLAGEAELLLDGVPGGHLGRGAVGAQQVPGVEAGEVLERAEDLVAADGGGDEAEVVSHRGVVDEGVGDHFWRCYCRGVAERERERGGFGAKAAVRGTLIGFGN